MNLENSENNNKTNFELGRNKEPQIDSTKYLVQYGEKG